MGSQFAGFKGVSHGILIMPVLGKELCSDTVVGAIRVVCV